MKTTHTLTNHYNGTNGFEDVAIFARPVNTACATEETWKLYRRVNPVTGRVRDFGVRYFRPGAVSPADLTFTSVRKAMAHLNSITGAVRVA
jgi:hypothetical protein